jgi:hypothetical protein
VAQLITIDVDDGSGGTAVFETDADLVPVDTEGVPGEGLTARARVSFQEALEQLRPTLSSVSRTLREMGPDEAEVEFGLKVGGETGVVVAKGTVGVNFAVRLVWRRG